MSAARARHRHDLIAALALIVVTGASASARAQAFTPEKGLISLTVLYQVVDNTGHRLTDGYMLRDGQSVSMGALVEGEYGVTDRFAVSLALPYVAAKYRGVGPTPANLPVDSCRCWHSGFADFFGSVRYRFGDDTFAFTPILGLNVPSHAYNYQGEAVLGRRLKEFRVGGSAALRPAFLPRAVVTAVYSYAIVEKDVVDIPNNRSNLHLDVGYSVGERWFVRANAHWQTTHGGLRFGSTPDSFLPFPGEVGFSGPNFDEHDRLLRDNHSGIGGSLAYALGRVDLFAAFAMYVSGTDAHATTTSTTRPHTGGKRPRTSTEALALHAEALKRQKLDAMDSVAGSSASASTTTTTLLAAPRPTPRASSPVAGPSSAVPAVAATRDAIATSGHRTSGTRTSPPVTRHSHRRRAAAPPSPLHCRHISTAPPTTTPPATTPCPTLVTSSVAVIVAAGSSLPAPSLVPVRPAVRLTHSVLYTALRAEPEATVAAVADQLAAQYSWTAEERHVHYERLYDIRRTCLLNVVYDREMVSSRRSTASIEHLHEMLEDRLVEARRQLRVMEEH